MNDWLVSRFGVQKFMYLPGVTSVAFLLFGLWKKLIFTLLYAKCRMQPSSYEPCE